MEVYEDMENIASDAPNTSGALNATTNNEGKENETGSWKRQEIYQIETGNQSRNAKVLKAAGGKRQIETRQSAKDQSASMTALKLIAKQRMDKKAQLER